VNNDEWELFFEDSTNAREIHRSPGDWRMTARFGDPGLEKAIIKA
jgi:hypothetical protein